MHYNFIKASSRRYLEEIANRGHEMKDVYDSVDIMQDTAWEINKPVYDVIQKLLETNTAIGGLPVDPEDPNNIPLPIKPVDIATNEDALKKWKREASMVHQARAKSGSKFIQVVQIVKEASLLKDRKEFFYPYQLNFRGRIYPVPSMLSPQSADYSRALIKFKYGKPMATEEAFNSFAVAGANLFGETDKEELAVRRQWVIDHNDMIISTANNPLEDIWWADADKPFSFLAFCFEYRDFANTDFDSSFVTTLPIQSDCSNSGLQHYSAMMRDETGGKATNLIPANKPHDVYGLVAEKLTMKLRDNADPMAKLWLDYGIDRKICKKPVMCLPYSLTMFSCRRYIHDHVEKAFIEKNKQHEFGDDLFKASNFLTPLMWECINDIIVGAKQIMKFLKDISRLVASENLPVTWTTPLGLPVQMMCYKKESKRVKTQMGDSIVKLSIAHDTNKISRRATSLGICPNYIHQLDGAVLQLCVVKAKELGVDNFSMIHDSFGCVASDSHLMGKALREAFCEIYEKDVLKNFADEMYAMLSEKNQKKFPKMPTKGKLDLDLVKQSVFFCI